MILARALNETLRHFLKTDPRIVVLGEDIADPYGGAFKVTRGLTTEFPERVRTTPVSEGAIAGIAAGLALSGYRPIAEIMFGDFLALCFDQVMNHITKYQAMYNNKVTCPVILRTPSGGGRGYGPTHSQSLEKHFLGIPHLRVVAASLYHDPKAIFETLLQQDSPVLYIEHKLLYPLHLALPKGEAVGDNLARVENSPGFLPTVFISPVPSPGTWWAAAPTASPPPLALRCWTREEKRYPSGRSGQASESSLATSPRRMIPRIRTATE